MRDLRQGGVKGSGPGERKRCGDDGPKAYVYGSRLTVRPIGRSLRWMPVEHM